MILIKTCGTFLKRCNSIYFMCKLHRACTTTPNCMVKVCASTCSSKYSEQYDDKDNVENFETKLMKLCKSADNKHVINLNALTSIIEDLENNNYNISETLSSLLLNWCGKILHNEPIKGHQELIDRTWNLLKAKKCKLTINDYHALLQVYIDSNYIINREQFLKNMSIPPEYDTYCLLLQIPSTNDCAFVDNILSKVQQNILPACSKIYDALKYAYAMNGNVEGILKVTDLISGETSTSFSLVNDVYLMYALAKNGKSKIVINTLKTIKLSVSDTLKLVKLISFSQNDLCIEEILKYSQPLTTEEKEVSSTIAKLVHAGNITNAYKLATCIPVGTKCGSIKNILALCLLRETIKLNMNPEIVITIIHDFEKQNFISNIWEASFLLALEESNNTIAFRIRDEIKATDVNIDLSYFMGLLKYNENDLYSIIAKLIDSNIIEEYNTFLTDVFSALNIKDPIATIIKMKKHGIHTSWSVVPMVKFLINVGRVQESIHACTFFKKTIDCQEILNSLFVQYKQTNDIESCVELVFKLSYNGHGFVATFVRNMIDQLQWEKNNIEHLILFLTAAKENKAVISLNDTRYIQKNICNMNIDDHFKNDILQLIFDISVTDNTQNFNSKQFVHPEYMNLKQLYTHFRELQSKNKNTRGVARKTFMIACKLNNVKLVEEIMREIEKNNLKWSAGMKLTLFDFYVKNKMIEKALQTLHETVCQFKYFKIDNFKILRLLTLLVEHNKLEEAYDIIKNLKYINHKPDAQMQINQFFDLLIRNYPNDIANMIDLLCENGYCTTKYQILRHLIFAQLDNDIEAAINIFEMCIKKYIVTLGRKELLLKLAKLSSNSPSKYDEMMKKTLINIETIHGTEATNVYLVLAYVQCNNKAKLQYLFETCEIKEDILMQELKYYKEQDILTIASTLLEIEKIRLESCYVSMYNFLLRICGE
ncbi:Leucine-rich PPR motif-containing protein, mitochondrial [Anthophora retusa]